MKKLIRNFLKRFGYDIIKTGIPYIPETKKTVVVKVGNFLIEMPGNNIQQRNYKILPDLNASFGRLAWAVEKKYPGMTTIDIGANVGDTIAILKSFVNSPVIAVEGDDISYQFLEKNVQQFSNVTIFKTFLGEKSQSINVDLRSLGWNTTIIPTQQGSRQITFKTVDEIIGDNGMQEQNIKLIKTDVEGFDTIVLRGALRTVEKYRPVLFLEYNRQIMKTIDEDGLSTVLLFQKLGYNRIAFFDHKGTLLLATSMGNTEVITYLHEYISSSNNLLGYYDIVIFSDHDADVANQYLESEKQYV